MFELQKLGKYFSSKEWQDLWLSKPQHLHALSTGSWFDFMER